MNLQKTALTLFISVMTICTSAANATTSVNTDDIQIVGLFKNAAVISVNHHNQMMRVGDQKHDVRLIAADSDKAIVEIHGRRMTLSMAETSAIQIGLPASSNASAHLMSTGDMYNVTGSINDQLADFVVDTGATYITMSEEHAQRLRLNYNNAKKIMVNTANGKATAHVFNIDKIRIGGIELKNVQAAVMYDLSSSRILLGMSFLNQVEMQHKDGLMILKKRS